MASFTAAGFVLALCTIAAHCATPKKGHLQPLGNHRPPDVPIDEYDDSNPLGPDRFYKDYVVPFKPVVFRGAARHSPAFQLWTDEYLAKEYGDLELRLEEKVEGESNEALPAGQLGIGRDVLKNFLANYRTSNGYIVSELPSPMFKEVAVLPCMACSVLQHKIQEVNLWISAQGAYSKIHRDAFNAINCLLNGTKDWFFIDSKYSKEVYVVHRSKWEMGGMSLVEPKRVDLEKYPKFADVRYSFVTINAGDCVYVPGGYYHQVKSYGTKNMAVSVLFSQMARGVHSRGCDGDEKLPYKLLNESEVYWPYPGSGIMSMGNLDIDFLRNVVDNFTLLHDDKLTADVFYEAMMDLSAPATGQTLSMGMSPEETIRFKKVAEKAFAELNVEKKPWLTVEELGKLSVEKWKTVSKIIEPVDISNTYEFEYSVIEPNAVIRRVRRFLERSESGKMTREDFVTIYTKKVHGSAYIGGKVFHKLDAENAGFVSKTSLDKVEEVLEEVFSNPDGREDVDDDEEEMIRKWAHEDDDEGEESDDQLSKDGEEEGEGDGQEDGGENLLETEEDPEATNRKDEL